MAGQELWRTQVSRLPKPFAFLMAAADALLRTGAVVFFSTAGILYLLQIGLRLTHQTVLWLDPLLQYLFVMAALFGAAYGVKTGESIKVEIFRKLSSRRWLRVGLNLISAVISGFLTAAFILRFREDWIRGDASDFHVPKWVLTLVYVLLFAITVFYFCMRALFRAADVDAEGHGAEIEAGKKS